jgi:hypothetical protein
MPVCVCAGADCFFGSLLFDYDTVEWLRSQLTGVPVVLVFESALDLMGQTRIGSFTMDPSGALSASRGRPGTCSLWCCRPCCTQVAGPTYGGEPGAAACMTCPLTHSCAVFAPAAPGSPRAHPQQ